MRFPFFISAVFENHKLTGLAQSRTSSLIAPFPALLPYRITRAERGCRDMQLLVVWLRKALMRPAFCVSSSLSRQGKFGFFMCLYYQFRDAHCLNRLCFRKGIFSYFKKTVKLLYLNSLLFSFVLAVLYMLYFTYFIIYSNYFQIFTFLFDQKLSISSFKNVQ